MYPAWTPHLNPFGCEIRTTEGKGRGVFATQVVPAQTTIDISPVLLFSKEEYDRHAQHTVIDHYSFRWRDGNMALGLGLGSIFNRSSTPNVSYILDIEHACIKFVTTRSIAPSDELCISNGNELWFEDCSGTPKSLNDDSSDDESLSIFANVDLDQPDESPDVTVIPETELPFESVAVGDTDDEEETGIIRTMDAWVMDILDPRQTADLIQWLKQSGHEHPSLKHAKYIRKWTDPDTGPKTTLLLTPGEFPPPSVPGDISPYIVPVPRLPARTMDQVKLKAKIWPVYYDPRNHQEIREEARRWTPPTVQWFRDAIAVLEQEAERARALGEIPVVSYIPPPMNAALGTRSFIAHDTRVSSRHPLRHSVFNLVRLVGDSGSPPESTPSQNGQNYLLTSLTLFTTHEPCIACSMALLHSRVKEVVYLYAMPETGGCGGLTCVPGLKGVNHRFKVWKWREVSPGLGGVQTTLDA